MKVGYIKLHRSSEDNVLYFSEPFTKRQARSDLLMTTAFKDGAITVRGNIIEVKRGQNGYSEDSLASRWQRSRGKVRRFLDYLETIQQIEQHKSKVKSIITIKNYDKYQGNDTTDSTTDGQQTDTIKKFKKPKIEEVKEYCLERKNNINAQGFIDFYESNGWLVGKNKMKDWRACIRTRESRNKKDNTKSQYENKESRENFNFM